MYFRADDGIHGAEWWKTDGTEGGTMIVQDIFTGSDSSLTEARFHAAILGNSLFFRATTSRDLLSPEVGLWKIGEAAAEAVLVRKFVSGFTFSPPEWSAFDDSLVFIRRDLAGAGQLWMTSGPSHELQLLHDFATPGPYTSQESFLEFNGFLCFADINAAYGKELWRSNGTPEGTFLIKDINPGPASSIDTTPPINFKGAAYFVATDADSISGLWKTDGTGAGTIKISGFDGKRLVAQSDRLFRDRMLFVLNDQELGYVFYESDGTEQGTKMIASLGTYPHHAPMQLLLYSTGESVFFSLDGELKMLRQDGAISVLNQQFVINYVEWGDSMLFLKRHPDASWHLWKSSLTGANFQILQSGTLPRFNVGDTGLGPLYTNGPFVLFGAGETNTGTELWRSDGTQNGTVLVKDTYPGEVSGFFMNGFKPLFSDGGMIYFAASDDLHGRELWRSDGTPDGTIMVEDLAPGFESSFPVGMIKAGGTLYYAVLNDGTGQAAIRKLLPAEPPPFGGGKMTTVAGEESVLSLAKLLAGLPEGVTVRDVASTSAAGGTVMVEAGGLSYAPPAGYQGADSFTVTLSDGQQGTVAITVHPPEWLARVDIMSATGEEVRLRFRYISGQEAVIERSVDLDEWEVAASAIADGFGSIFFNDSAPPAGGAYYRLARPVRRLRE